MHSSERQRVVVTGLGVVSSIGIGWQLFWKALLSGTSGISDVTDLDTTNLPTHRAGQIRDFNAEEFINNPRSLRRYSRTSQLAIASARMAISDARLSHETLRSSRVGVAIGTTMADAQALEKMNSLWVEGREKDIPRRLVPQYPGNAIAAHVAIELGCAGPNIVFGTACSAGNYAISRAFDLIRLGKADLMIAAGADAFSRVAFMGFNRLLVVAPEKCQPFDRNRKGMMVGEGSAALILEPADRAKARGAPIYAEILGYGITCDANHMTIPDTEGIQKVMIQALKNSNLEIENIDYISAHGTGTHANDRAECSAIRGVFGSNADRLCISSIKSMLGHAMGAASALEAVASVLAVRHQAVPPTINFEEPDPECQIDCVPNISRRCEVRNVLNNSFAFGGNNACVVFGQC